MPLHDYRCQACQASFEKLVRHDSPTAPACPACGATEVERVVSRIAPAGKIEAIRSSNRRHAAAQGHMSNYSPAERAKLLK